MARSGGIITAGFLALAAPASAEGQAFITASATPLIPGLAPGGSPATQNSASLFAGRDGAGLFAPMPERAPVSDPVLPPLAGDSALARLLSLIAAAEAGPAGYDAVQHGARIRPYAAPTALTLAEIAAWTADTPGQPHAIGRYQFIPATLRRLVLAEGLPPHTRFSPQVQDRLALRLVTEAGLSDFLSGALPRETFMHNLARIWAGLPLPSGRSYYDGHAGNRATMSWATFDAGMTRIFGPQSQVSS